MKRLAVLFAIVILILSGCSAESSTSGSTEPVEQPHLYWKDINVTVTDIDKRHWFAGTHWYVVDIEVYSEEYGLTGSFEEEGSGIWGRPEQWDYEIGDVVKARLYSWVMDSTGEVVKREINKVY